MRNNLFFPARSLWLSIFSLFFLFSLSVSYSCDECKENDPKKCDTSCTRQGECIITYRYDSEGELTNMKRRCTWLEKEDGTRCSECSDEKKDDKGNLISQKCVVCNICNEEFQCLGKDDCQGGLPLCHRGACVPCITNADCKDDNRPHCSEKGCVACQKDQDCRDKDLPHCYEGICVSCRCATTTPDKPFCKKETNGTVTCVGCTENSHCKSPTPICDTKKNVCINECQKDDDCSSKEFCVNGSCSSCRDRNDCKDPLAPRCVEGKCQCLQGRDCPSEYPICHESKCVECTKDGDCPAGFPRCTSGECQLKLCTSKADCTVPTHPLCRRVGRREVCVGCTADSDCASGLKCDLSTFTCRN